MRFMNSAIVLAVVPMTLLQSGGRPAFLGYYLGVLALWLAAVISGTRLRQAA